MKDYKISIIIPIYNVEKYLEKCIESCLSQTYKNLEIILVNDGSTDNSKNICELYMKKDKRIVYIEKNNGGLSDARNMGIRKAKGDYFFFLDSDDWINNDSICKLVHSVIKCNSDIVVGCYLETSEKGTYGENVFGPKKEEVMSGIDSVNKLINEGNSIGVVVWNKLYKKELFDHVIFEKGKIHEDVYFTPKVLYYAKKVSFINDVVYFYRNDREGSITNKKLSKRNLDSLDGFKSNYLFFKDASFDTFSNEFLMKYFDMIIEYYCLFRVINNKNISFYLLKLFKNEYLIYKRNIINSKNIKEIIKLNLFKLNKDFFYFIWKNKRKV